MSHLEMITKENDAYRERFALITERVRVLLGEEPEGNLSTAGVLERPEAFSDFFRRTAELLVLLADTEKLAERGFPGCGEKELSSLNKKLYHDLIGENYSFCYANPTFAAEKLTGEYGEVLCFLLTELYGLIPCAFEQKLFDMTIEMELFVEIYNLIKWEEDPLKAIRSAVYYYMKDYCAERMDRRIRELLDPSLSFAAEIIMESDLEDMSYLYRFGEYIGKNELETAAFLNGRPQEEIDRMAATFTEGYREGFENNGIDLSGKRSVNIRYVLGFERIVRAAVKQFDKMGLKPTVYRAASISLHKRQNLKIGYAAIGPNRQFDYDHRFDDGLYLCRPFLERKLEALESAYEHYRELAAVYAGPAVMEVFGEEPFSPADKKEAVRLSEKQQKLAVWYQTQSSLIINRYVNSAETSFTIIAYPIPEIGPRYTDIFAETVKVNTLDKKTYLEIQQRLIDALDRGDYVTITGAGINRTNLRVMLNKLSNPEKETNFENCLADVNIPAGEVFTSPRLAGTEGVLHVSSVYMNDLHYKDLELAFADGKIVSYTCKNFALEEENTRFVKENLMFQHDTLPLGEFAIGTNTTAYRMGKKYNIASRLPILIAEKTGPHFAVGDTCYKMSEENRVYNPDGKEIVAKDNACSLLRKTDPEKAYFNCHTDITIPYDELGRISVHTRQGGDITILLDGRFVLPGTEELNGPLEIKD